MSRDEAISDDGLGRAWIGVGVPILGLIFIVMMLAVATLAGFAKEQDRVYVEATQRLMAGSSDGRAQALAAVARDYAHWNDAYQNISVAWNPDWVEGNMYSTNADGMILFRAEGVVRYAWFNDDYQGEAADVQSAAIVAARAVPSLRSLSAAPLAEGAVVSTMTRVGGRLMIIGVAAVSPEQGAQARSNRGADYLAIIDVVETDKLASVGAALDLADLRFIPGASTADQNHIQHTLSDASGRVIGALRWRHAHPGAVAFSRQIWPVIIGLLCIGALAILVARLLVTRQVRTMSSARSALETSKSRSEFLTRVSHELRTPLNAIIGYAELIQEDTKSQESRGDADRIVSAARHLSHLLNDIIDQSRIDSGRVKFSYEVLPVAGMLAEVQGILGSSARAAGVQLNISPSSLAGFVYADHVRTRQCLLNIIGNAIKFSPRGAAVVVRTRLETAGARNMVVIDVTDTGIGVHKDDLDHIFRPFGQANAGIGRSFGGAGLGLSIARDLAREMGGDVTVVSGVGEGSTFSLSIPATASGALHAA